MPTMTRQKLIVYRVEAGFHSQQDLADATGISRETINAIENGKRLPSMTTKLRIVKALKQRGVPVAVDDIDWNEEKP
jgi:DNA-binding XRE family transcriptional regulator